MRHLKPGFSVCFLRRHFAGSSVIIFIRGAALIAFVAASLVSCSIVPAEIQSRDSSIKDGAQVVKATPITVATTESALSGRIVTKADVRPEPLSGAAIRLGRVHWNPERTHGAFVFDGASSPSVISEADGSFAFLSLEPGEYVIMVGDPMGEYEIVAESREQARVFKLEAGKQLDVGTIEVSLTPQ